MVLVLWQSVGNKKCNLILVPIYMQFKLVIENIFEEYPFDEAAFPMDEGELVCIIEKKNMEADLSEINLILEDTYVIESEQIPCCKQNLPTIKISRNNGKSHTRRYSPNFINAISEEIRRLPQVSIVNIYATTNPRNMVQIIRSTFKWQTEAMLSMCLFINRIVEVSVDLMKKGIRFTDIFTFSK